MRAVIATILRLGVAGLLLYAGIVKVLDPAGFAIQIENYRMVNRGVATMLAAYLPWLEMVTGAALLLRQMYLAALIVAMALMVVFTAAVGAAWYRGLDIACGCFGSEHITTATGLPLLRNLLLLAAIALLLILDRRQLGDATADATAPSPAISEQG